MFHFCFFKGQCKVEMEKKYQEYKILTGDIFKEQLQEQLNEKTKKLRTFSDNLLRENVHLKKENQKIDVLQKLHDNITRQVSLHETLIDKQKADTSNLQSTVEGLTERNKELQVTVDGLTESNKELQVTVNDLIKRNKELQVTVTDLTDRIKELQVTVTDLTKCNKEITGRNEELQVTVRAIQDAFNEMQNRMTVVEEKIQCTVNRNQAKNVTKVI